MLTVTLETQIQEEVLEHTNIVISIALQSSSLGEFKRKYNCKESLHQHLHLEIGTEEIVVFRPGQSHSTLIITE